ncbi:MAG: DUF4294 domain-containing protein [Bacteroidaceae bacterium]|jgi:hypothetical protein|nr:DUF4294 domain-containing protein [Bacteroidaceae bacterium]
MIRRITILFVWLSLGVQLSCLAQNNTSTSQSGQIFITRGFVYQGDTIPWIQLRTVHVFKELNFKKKKDYEQYQRLIRDVKKVLPIANEVNAAIIETYEYLQTIPTEKERKRHIKDLEKGIKQQYTPRLKKLTTRQGKLLIRLIDRQSNQTTYELVKAFLGSFRAATYQVFASMFGFSLKKQYDPEGDDALTERVIILVENGQV